MKTTSYPLPSLPALRPPPSKPEHLLNLGVLALGFQLDQMGRWGAGWIGKSLDHGEAAMKQLEETHRGRAGRPTHMFWQFA